MSARGLRKGAWTVQELDRLRQLLPWIGVDASAALLRRSPDAVRRRAALMLQNKARRGEWTEADDEALRTSWGALEPRLLGSMLGRPSAEVIRRANALRGHRREGAWSHEDDQLLKRVYATRATRDLEVCLQRSSLDIESRAKSLCLQKDKKFASGKPGDEAGSRQPRWTAAEVATLRGLYATRDNLVIAQQLGRSVDSVANKAWQLGLHKGASARARIGRANVAFRFREQG